MSKSGEMKVRSIRLRTKTDNDVVCPRQKELPNGELARSGDEDS